MKASAARSNSKIPINSAAPIPPPDDLIPIAHAASEVGLSRAGLRLLLLRTNKAIRHDGRLYVSPEIVAGIKAAYTTLGIHTHALRGGLR